jgi:hypothetical protein
MKEICSFHAIGLNADVRDDSKNLGVDCFIQVISVVGPRKGVLSPNDILLLFNFVSSSDAFR